MNKRIISEKKDADFIFLDKTNDIQDVIINSEIHIQNTKLLIKGTYKNW